MAEKQSTCIPKRLYIDILMLTLRKWPVIKMSGGWLKSLAKIHEKMINLYSSLESRTFFSSVEAI